MWKRFAKPPKPGITLMTSTKSQCGKLASIVESGVADER